MRCHYCGYKEGLLARCAACGSTQLKAMGYGTEKLEEEMSLLTDELEKTKASKAQMQSRLQHTLEEMMDLKSESEMDAKYKVDLEFRLQQQEAMMAQQQQQQGGAPASDPNQAFLMAEQMKAQGKAQVDMAKLQLDAQKASADQQFSKME